MHTPESSSLFFVVVAVVNLLNINENPTQFQPHSCRITCAETNFALKFRAESKKKEKKMGPVQALTIVQEVRVTCARLSSRAEHYLAENGREGEVSAAVELIKTAAAGFREQERNFFVACYKFTIKKGGKLRDHQTCRRLMLREKCERKATQVLVPHCKAEWRRFFPCRDIFFVFI